MVQKKITLLHLSTKVPSKSLLKCCYAIFLQCRKVKFFSFIWKDFLQRFISQSIIVISLRVYIFIHTTFNFIMIFLFRNKNEWLVMTIHNWSNVGK